MGNSGAKKKASGDTTSAPVKPTKHEEAVENVKQSPQTKKPAKQETPASTTSKGSDEVQPPKKTYVLTYLILVTLLYSTFVARNGLLSGNKFGFNLFKSSWRRLALTRSISTSFCIK